jgi:hypothetical protein
MPADTAKALEQYERYVYMRDHGHLEFIEKADKCDNYFVGKQWLQSDLDRLRLQRRPALTINKIISTVATILGEQIYNRTEVLFRPTAGAPAEVAEALSKVWMQISQNNQLPWTRSDVFCDGIIRSRGFYDVRMGFSDSLKGEVELSMMNSKNVVIDPDAEEYDPDAWSDVMLTKWVTPDDIAILYSMEEAEYLKAKTNSEWLYGYDSIERTRDRFGGKLALYGAYPTRADDANVQRNIRLLERQYRKLDKQEHFVDIATGDMRPIPVDWDRDRIAAFLAKAGGQLSTYKKLVKRVRWCVTADNVVLHDEWSPYKHFTTVPYFPYFLHGQTVGIVENLLGPQDVLNKTTSQELHVVNTTANSGWKIKRNSLQNMSVEELEQNGAQTGLVLELDEVTSAEKIQPNQIPTGLDRLSYKAEEAIKSISNVSDSMQGFDREDVAAKAIAYKQQRGSVNLTKVLDNLERTDWILARNVLDLVQSYYGERRIINITHDDVTREPEQIVVNEVDPATGAIVNDLTIGEYDIVVTSSPFRASMEDSQFEQAKALRELGIAIPDSVLIENSRMMRRSEIVKQMEAAKSSPEALAAADRAVRAEEAEVALKEAQALKTRVDAEKSGADTTLKQQEAQGGQGAELMKLQAELQMERERLDMELAKMREELRLKQEEMQMKLDMQAQDHVQKQQMKQEEHEQNLVLRERQAEQQAAAQRAQGMRESSEAADADTTTTTSS